MIAEPVAVAISPGLINIGPVGARVSFYDSEAKGETCRKEAYQDVVEIKFNSGGI